MKVKESWGHSKPASVCANPIKSSEPVSSHKFGCGGAPRRRLPQKRGLGLHCTDLNVTDDWDPDCNLHGVAFHLSPTAMFVLAKSIKSQIRSLNPVDVSSTRFKK